MRLQSFKPPTPIDPDVGADIVPIRAGETRSLDPGAYSVVDVPEGATLKLTSGIYFVRDGMRLDGARLVVEAARGPVYLYIGKELTLRNSRLNPDDVGPDTFAAGESTSGLPSNLRVLMCGNGSTAAKATLSMTDGSAAWMVITGRGLNASITNSALYGNVRGQRVEVSNGVVHYDEGLGSVALDANVVWSNEGLADRDVHEKALQQIFPDLNAPQPSQTGPSSQSLATPEPSQPTHGAPTHDLSPTPATSPTPESSPTNTSTGGGGGGGGGGLRDLMQVL